MFETAFFVLSLACGYLAWRGSGKVWNGVLAATTVPIAALFVVGAIAGREGLFEMNLATMFLAIVAVLAVMVYLARNS